MSGPADEQEEQLWRDLIRWRVKEVARSRGVQSAQQRSERSGIDTNSVTSFWNGSALWIDRDSLGKLCHRLQCTPGDLLVFVGEPREEERS